MKSPNCTIIVPTFNEEIHLVRCIQSVQSLGPVFVLDGGSGDRTNDIALKLGAHFVQHPWTGYASQKNWGLDNLPIETKWVLFLDADEWLSDELRAEIISVLASPTENGYYLPRQNIFMGRTLKHAWWYPDYQLRLFKKEAGRFEERDVHEHVVVEGSLGYLNNPLQHENLKGLDAFMQRHERYARYEAREIVRAKEQKSGAPTSFRSFLTSWPVRRRWLKVRVWYRLPGRPAIRFFWMYVLQRGFLDGREGLIYCQLLASYEALIDANVLELAHAATTKLKTGPHKGVQSAYYDEEADPLFEITRPHGTPRLYKQLLEDKYRRSVAALGSLSGRSALTVCGGSGMDAEFLAGSGARVVATDLSVGASRRASDRFGRFLLAPATPPVIAAADIEQLPFRDRSFDLIYVHDGLHHLEKPEIGLREMCRVASWAVSLTEPAEAAITRLAVKLGRAEEIEEAGNRVARLDLPAVTRILESEGFTIVRAQRYAMYYKHRPGWVMRLLSLPVLNSLAWLAFDFGNVLIGRWGNKITVQAIRSEHLNR